MLATVHRGADDPVLLGIAAINGILDYDKWHAECLGVGRRTACERLALEKKALDSFFTSRRLCVPSRHFQILDDCDLHRPMPHRDLRIREQGCAGFCCCSFMFAPLREAHPRGCRTTGLGFSLRLTNGPRLGT